MKKTGLYLLTMLLIFLTMIVMKIYEYNDAKTKLDNYNSKYEVYLEKEIHGTEIATIINMAVDDNENAFVKKAENGKYLQDNEKSINIEIKINDLEENKIYSMESLYTGGMEQFINYYREILFKSSEVRYRKNGQISYILFEQVSN